MPDLAGILSRFLEAVLRLLFPAAILVAIGVFVFLLIGRINLINSWNPDLGGVEPNVIYGIQRIIDGKPLYSNPNQPPYAVMMYSPLYFHTVAIVGKLLGVNPDEAIEVYRISRTMSLVFNLLFIGILGWIAIRHFDLRISVAIIISSLLFSYLRITDFGRPDSLYHLTIIGTFALGFSYLGNRHTAYGLAAVVLSAVCLFTKQSGLIIPVILFFYLIFYDRSRLLIAVPTFLIAFGLLWLILSGNDYNFWQNVYQGVNNGISWDWFKRRILFFYLREIAFFSGLVLVLAVLFITKFTTPKHNLLGVALFGLFFFALLTALKWGSMPSYFTPFIALGWLSLAAYLYDNSLTLSADWRNALLGGVALCCFVTEVPSKYESYRLQSYNTEYKYAKQVTDYLKNDLRLKADERVLILINQQHLMERHFLNNLLFRNALIPSKDIFSCCAYPHKKFDYRELDKKMENGMVTYLVRSKGDVHIKLFKWDFNTFQKLKELNGYSVWKYAPDIPK